MPQILLAGAPTGCWTNLGDEAILVAMLSSLREVVAGADVTVVSSNREGFLAGHGCREVRFEDVEGIVRAVAASDLVVLGGGSIFFDYWGCEATDVLTPRHHGLTLWTGIALAAAANDVPCITWGVGIGPLRGDDARLLTRATFEVLDGATVRDPDSADTLRLLGFDRAVVTGDPVLRLASFPADVPDDAAAPRRPVLGVALRHWDVDVDEQRWTAEVAAAIDRELDASSGTVRFVPFHRSRSWPLSDDTSAAEAVIDRLADRSRVELVPVDTPWPERARLVRSCDAVLAMRYHAALLALAAGTPTVGLCYDPKVTGLFRDWGFADVALAVDADADALAASLAQVRRQAPAFAERALARAAELVERERASAVIAATLLDRPGRSDDDAGTVGHAAGTGEAGSGPSALEELLTRLGPDPARPPAAAAVLDALRPDGRERPAAMPTTAQHARRVAILTNRVLDRATGKPAIGGAERYGLDLARLLADLGLSPTFFQQGGDWERGEFFGFPVVALPVGESDGEFALGAAESFAEATVGFDHVLVLAPNYAAGRLRDDAIVVCHGVWWDHDLWTHLEFRTPGWYDRLEQVFTRGAAVVSVDESTIGVVRALFPHASDRLRLIPNSVDTTRFHPPSTRDSDVPTVVFPRRAEVVRGPRLVGPMLAQAPDPLRAVWVGDGDPAMIDVLRAAADADPRLSVTTAGFDDMPAIYRDADVVVIPTVASEGQSLAALEAMASGCAVIVTRVGGLPELVTDGVDGLVCDPDPASLADALRLLVRDPWLRRRLGVAARRTATLHDQRRWRQAWADLLAEHGWIDRTSPAVPYDVVCFSIIDWTRRFQRPQQRARAWARRGRRVFYLRITEHLDPATRPGEIDAVELEPGLWEIRLSLPDYDVYAGDIPDDLVSAGMASLRTLRERFGISEAVGLVELATWHPLAVAARDGLGWPIVYDCMDDWSTFPGFDERPAFLDRERSLVEDADLMVVSSGTIARRWEHARPDLVLARNATDFAFFAAAEGPDPLPDVEGPVAGFFGAIVQWFDVALLTAVAAARPDVTFVLVGNVARVDVTTLEALPNVRFEGMQPYEAMPRYLRRFDVAIIPFVVGPTTDGMDVVKVYEYLSQGVPVVTTPIREIVAYGDVVRLADDASSFGAALDEALAEAADGGDAPERARRVELARRNTWDDRVAVFERVILDHLAGTTTTTTTTAQKHAPARPAGSRRQETPVPGSAPTSDALGAELAELAEARIELGQLRAAQVSMAHDLDAYRRSRAVRVAGLWWSVRRLATGGIRRRHQT